MFCIGMCVVEATTTSSVGSRGSGDVVVVVDDLQNQKVILYQVLTHLAHRCWYSI